MEDATSALAGFCAGRLFLVGDKSVEALGSKILFSNAFPPETMLIFLLLRLRSPQRPHKIDLMWPRVSEN